MKKTTRLLCLLLSLLLVGQAVVLLSACSTKVDPETTPLTLSTDALDGVFNPFSYTSGPDGGVVGQTQIGMLNIDENGNVVAGWDQPTVAEAYSVVTTGSKEDDIYGDYANFYTDYYFVIKDGIKFSDGTDLTIKDVLFNMYVYLDPVYTGSSTMYSVDIKGLSEYRTQRSESNAQDALNTLARARADQRKELITNWCTDPSAGPIESYYSGDTLKQVRADLAKIKELFTEELNTDWVAAASMVEEYEKYYLETDEVKAITDPARWTAYTAKGNRNTHISQQWEVFAIMYGLITTKTELLGERGSPEAVRKYTFEYSGSDKYDHSQEKMVERAFVRFFPEGDQSSSLFKSRLYSVIEDYATSGTYYDYIFNLEKEAILKEDGMQFPDVSGIRVYKAKSIPTSETSSGETSFDSDRTILTIRINGIDPKAIYSFSFSVASMAHYSTKEAMEAFGDPEPELDEETGITYLKYTGFGVDFASTDFMNHINTNHVPIGAGPYRASNGTASGVADDKVPTKGEFFRNNIVNFERNNYFYTVMKDGHNAKIKFMRYKVIAASNMRNAVTSKKPEVHISQPAASRDEINEIRNLINKGEKLKYIDVDYMGYGYIGINASFVHDRLIRQAIMHAMDTTLVGDYYGSTDLYRLIYRPMSYNSWAYPKDETEPYYEFDDSENHDIIRDLVRRAGYTQYNSDGTLYKGNDQLKFTFTVAGDSEDHPAYQTMVKAAAILNECGFNITVTKDTQALSKLASGGLQVWAAAWSSGIDPDMYQVYHKDSTASSVKNWGYDYILNKSNDEQDRRILRDLSDLIDQGREFMTQDERKPIYWEALDKIMELAVELPTYQRKEMYLINTGIVDETTLCKATMYQGPLSKIWEVNFVIAE